MDLIRIRSLELDVFLGVYEAEQAAPRRAVADIELGVDLSRAAASDDLADTVDYDALARTVRDAVSAQATTSKRYALVERLAGEIADICLAFDPRVESARVIVAKPGAIPAASVEVEIRRSRQRRNAR